MKRNTFRSNAILLQPESPGRCAVLDSQQILPASTYDRCRDACSDGELANSGIRTARGIRPKSLVWRAQTSFLQSQDLQTELSLLLTLAVDPIWDRPFARTAEKPYLCSGTIWKMYDSVTADCNCMLTSATWSLMR
jgi:hypothetical protein